MKVLDVANYIKHLAEVYGDTELTPMKLQKLLYYSYGYYLSFKSEKLFDAKIEKWKHGPVIPEIWHLTDKQDFLKTAESGDLGEALSEDQKTIIEDVFKLYGRFAAWTLSNMTHSELPWKTAHMNGHISDESIKNFFDKKKEEFVFDVESLEDLEDVRIAKSDPDDKGEDWEDLKNRLQPTDDQKA